MRLSKWSFALAFGLALLFGNQGFAGDVSPRLISYICANDGNTDWANPSSPYTHYMLAFLIQYQPDADPTADLVTAGGWTDQQGLHGMGSLQFNANTHIVDHIHAAGKKAMIAYGGATMDWNYYKHYVGKEAQLASKLAQIVKDNNLDGIDLDWEDTGAFTHSGSIYNGRQFLINLTNELRKPENLPQGQYLLSHAPQSPYLQKSLGDVSGYTDVMAAVGDKIDFLDLQYYNNNPTSAPGVVAHYINAINETDNLTARQLLVGKPVVPANASTGYLPVETIRDGIVAPLVAQYGDEFGGVFNWEFKSDKDPNFHWGDTVSEAFPVPEPASFLLALIGLLSLMSVGQRPARRRR